MKKERKKKKKKKSALITFTQFGRKGRSCRMGRICIQDVTCDIGSIGGFSSRFFMSNQSYMRTMA
jgi:hypothetical protein